MRIEELINIMNEIDDVLHGYGIVVDHDILTNHLLKAIKESYPNDDIELEPQDLKVMPELKTLPDIV